MWLVRWKNGSSLSLGYYLQAINNRILKVSRLVGHVSIRPIFLTMCFICYYFTKYFLSSLNRLSLYLLNLSIKGINKESVLTAIEHSIASFIIGIMAFQLGIFTGSMLISHTYLILSEKTTHEHIKAKRSKKKEDVNNPFSENLVKNAIKIMCAPKVPK